MKIISFSLWGNLQRYTIGCIKNVLLAKKYYPDWSCWIYYDPNDVPSTIVDILSAHSNVRMIKKSTENNKHKQLLWRLEAIEDDDVQVAIFRNVDERLNLREVSAVNEWLYSGYNFHSMKDKIQHLKIKSVIGGLFGINKNNKTLEEILGIKTIKELDVDEITFFEKLKHKIDLSLLEHKTNNFPIRYSHNFNFVGEKFYQDDIRDTVHINFLKKYLLENDPSLVQDMITSVDCAYFFGKPSIDDFKMYLCQRIFYGRLGVITKFVILTDTMPDFISDTISDEIELFVPLSSMDINKQINLLRHYYPCTKKDDYIKSIILTSPLNIVPLGTEFFYECMGRDVLNCFHVGENNQIYIGSVDKWRDIFTGIYTLEDIYNSNIDTLNIPTNKIYHSIQKEPWLIGNKNINLDDTFIDISYNMELASNMSIDDNKPIGTFFIIHYNKLRSRAEFMKQQIIKTNLSSICSSIVWINSFDREKISNINPEYDPGIMASTLAHISAIERTSKQFKPCVIVEDDILFRENYINNLTYVVNSLTDIATLGGEYNSLSGLNSYIQREFILVDPKNTQLVSPPDRYENIFNAYAITPKCAQELLDRGIKNNINKPIYELTFYDLSILWSKPFICSDSGLFVSSV